MRLVNYLIEYLGEFEFIFETVLDSESRDQMGSFEAKKTKSKISCLGTFKGPKRFLPLALFLVMVCTKFHLRRKLIFSLGVKFCSRTGHISARRLYIY
jgi:hypothetical protein